MVLKDSDISHLLKAKANLTINAVNFKSSVASLSRFAMDASEAKVQLHIKNIAALSVSDLKAIANKGKGFVHFDLS